MCASVFVYDFGVGKGKLRQVLDGSKNVSQIESNPLN